MRGVCFWRQNQGFSEKVTKHTAHREKYNRCYRGNRKEVAYTMPYDSRKLGLLISTERSNRQMSQKQLSALTGISRSHLADLESGRKSPNLKTFWRLAQALSMKPSELLAKLESQTHQAPSPETA